MKNKILAICLLSSHIVLGQFVAGTKMLQGNFNLQIAANGNDKNDFNHFTRQFIGTGIGTQIARIESETQQWGLGGNLSYSNQTDKSTNKNNNGSSISSNSATSFSFGVNIFQTKLKKILPNFYGGLRYNSGLGYALASYKGTNEQTGLFTQPASPPTTSSDKQNSASVNIGITSQFYYFITPKWGLSANIGYIDATLGHNFKNKIWSFNANSGFNGFGLGLFKILHP
jgi:hypothetical protein